MRGPERGPGRGARPRSAAVAYQRTSRTPAGPRRPRSRPQPTRWTGFLDAALVGLVRARRRADWRQPPVPRRQGGRRHLAWLAVGSRDHRPGHHAREGAPLRGQGRGPVDPSARRLRLVWRLPIPDALERAVSAAQCRGRRRCAVVGITSDLEGEEMPASTSPASRAAIARASTCRARKRSCSRP